VKQQYLSLFSLSLFHISKILTYHCMKRPMIFLRCINVLTLRRKRTSGPIPNACELSSASRIGVLYRPIISILTQSQHSLIAPLLLLVCSCMIGTHLRSKWPIQNLFFLTMDTSYCPILWHDLFFLSFVFHSLLGRVGGGGWGGHAPPNILLKSLILPPNTPS
jgi:hypothetical protein